MNLECSPEAVGAFPIFLFLSDGQREVILVCDRGVPERLVTSAFARFYYHECRSKEVGARRIDGVR